MRTYPNVELTTTQKLIYELYCAHVEEHGVAPSALLIAERLGIARSGVYDALSRLEARGYLKKKPVTVQRLMPVKRRGK